MTCQALRTMAGRRLVWARQGGPVACRPVGTQVAAIQEDLARPARQAPAAACSPRASRTGKQADKPRPPAQAGSPTARRRRRALPLGDVEQALAEQLASPLAATAAPTSPAAGRRET